LLNLGDYYERKIPQIIGRTKQPRQAAKTKNGRERLEALLLHYERNDAQMN
jgi:hypothetical protein